MKQYLQLLKDIKEKGTWKDPARKNLPRTLSLFGTRMEFDMKDGFPLLTTKKVYFKGIITELLWFLKGDTNIKYLLDNGCNIWNQDAYRWYLKCLRDKNHLYSTPQYELSFEKFIEFIKVTSKEDLSKSIEIKDSDYKLGDLGKVYGHQWRSRDGIDQIQIIVDRLNSDPMGRYAILDAWNPLDFSEMALPPCHLLYQFNCRKINIEERNEIWQDYDNYYDDIYLDSKNCPKYYLDLQLYQRSCDTFLGVPFNIASGAALLHIISKAVNMQPGKFIWIGGDTHVYENHLEAVEEQLNRTPTELPKLYVTDFTSLDQLQLNFLNLVDYNPQSTIKAELKTGL